MATLGMQHITKNTKKHAWPKNEKMAVKKNEGDGLR